jgi:long-chain acyl-CoA synthetase
MNTLTELLESFAGRNTLAIKFIGDYRTFAWTYRELYQDARKFAALLSTRGVTPGDKVLIWGPNSPEWAIAFFGIAAAGAVAVPVDYRSDAAFAGRIAAAAGTALAVRTRFRPALPGDAVIWEEIRDELVRVGKVGRVCTARPAQTAELVYTSGTTGTPKGVMISHHNLLSNITAVARRIHVGEQDRFLSVLPLSHLFEQTGGFLAPLYRGGAIVYLNTIKPSAILNALKKEPVTIMTVVPRLLFGLQTSIQQRFSGVWAVVLRTLGAAADRLNPPARKKLFFFIHRKVNPHFRFFVCGGAWLDPETEIFWDRLGFTIIQGYGLTECSPILTANAEADRRIGSIGTPLDNVELTLARDQELLAKGPNVFAGYYQDPEKTAAAFREGWFLTGDIGARDRDGFFYIKGRKKDLIVTPAGINVYPEEIESILNQTPGIKESAVVGLAGEGGETVAAVLVPAAAESDLAAAVAAANAKLDAGRQISRFFVWDENELPKTTTLKIKKNMVREWIARPEKIPAPGSGFSPLGRLIAAVARVPETSVTPDSCLTTDLGLDSIGRVELVSRLEQEFGLDFEEELIGTATTVAQLERLVAAKTGLVRAIRFPAWGFTKKMRRMRGLWFSKIPLGIVGRWCRVTAVGLSNLSGLCGPVIFAPNHCSYFDQPVFLNALPPGWRANVATAAWDEFFRAPESRPLLRVGKRVLYCVTVSAAGIFGLSQQGDYQKSLRFAGALADKGLSLLIFPEGGHSHDGALLPFRKGIALLAGALRLPVVPVRIRGTRKALPHDARWPRRAEVEVTFGQPLCIGSLSQEQFLARVRQAILAL